MKNTTEETIKQETLHWVSSFIVKLNICPFAKHVVDNKTLNIQVNSTNDETTALDSVLSTLSWMDQSPETETLLMVYPNLFSEFYDYLDFVDCAEALMYQAGYEGIYQFATFHPNYCFEGEAENAPSNYTNRSPYPMLHILREASLDKAIEFYGDTSKIPENNIKTLNDLGIDKILEITQGK